VLRARGQEGELESILERQALPSTLDELRARARAALDGRRAEAALAATDAALALEPKDFDMLMTRAGALELLASTAGVEASLLRAREIEPLRASVGLSLFYLRHQRFADAAAIADGVLK
jgi:hypothetical protein